MQTIHISVNDNYANKLINMLENLKGIMFEDIKVDKKIESKSADEAWDEL